MSVVVVAPPRVIGIADVKRIFGIRSHQTVYDRLTGGDPLITTGYMGKANGRHIWNAHVLLTGMFASPVDLEAFIDGRPTTGAVCVAAACAYPANYHAGLCYWHFARLLDKIRQAERSPAARLHLIAMCRWVVARNADVDVPEFNPFAETCVWDDHCDTPVDPGAVGPFCRTHMRMLYGHPSPPPLVRRSIM